MKLKSESSSQALVGFRFRSQRKGRCHDDLGQYVSALSYHSKILTEGLHVPPLALAQQTDGIRASIPPTNEPNPFGS